MTKTLVQPWRNLLHSLLRGMLRTILACWIFISLTSVSNAQAESIELDVLVLPIAVSGRETKSDAKPALELPTQAELAPQPTPISDPAHTGQQPKWTFRRQDQGTPSLLAAPDQPSTCSNAWWDAAHWTFLPRSLLWEPPLANQLQPRMFAKATSLSNEFTSSTVETAIGGTAGLFRYGLDDECHEGFQIDGFAVVFSRWADLGTAVAVDYRAGIPFTYASGPWEAKIAYEHTSTHLGDTLIENTGRKRASHVRDEAVLGLSYRFAEELRVYGILGVPLQSQTPGGHNTFRYDWGLEWYKNRTTSWCGQPYAAFDMELREDQDYTPNITLQVGWMWKVKDWRSFRAAVEFYDGKSPYGQFFQQHEQWIAVGLFMDF